VEGRGECKKCEAWLLPGGKPFLKVDFPVRAPKRHGQVSPNAHKGTQPMAWGPTLRNSRKEHATALQLYALPSSP
jgi:hypothetical protein